MDAPKEGRCNHYPTSSGGYCGKWPMNGRTRCMKHGGKTLLGAAHPGYKDGRRSKYKTLGKYKEAVERSLNDETILEQYNQIALLNARIEELIGELGADKPQPDWIELKKNWNQMQVAISAGNQLKANERVATIGQLIMDGNAYAKTWDDIGKNVIRQSRIIESERKRAVESHELVKANLVLIGYDAFFAATVETIKKYVTDKAIVKSLLIDIGNAYALQLQND